MLVRRYRLRFLLLKQYMESSFIIKCNLNMETKQIIKYLSPKRLFEVQFYLLSILNWNSLDYRHPSLCIGCFFLSLFSTLTIGASVTSIGQQCSILFFEDANFLQPPFKWIIWIIIVINFLLLYIFLKKKNRGLKILVRGRNLYRTVKFRYLLLHFIVNFLFFIFLPGIIYDFIKILSKISLIVIFIINAIFD